MAKKNFQYGGWNSYTLHDHDVDFTRWLHPAMWHVALGSWHSIRQVAVPCSVAGGSGMTCHWIRPNICHTGILHLVLISTTSPQSTYHSAPVSEILSKSDHPRQKNMTSCRFSRWRISAILDLRDPIVGFFWKAQLHNFLYVVNRHRSCELFSFFEKIAFLHFGVKIQDGGSPPS